MLNIIQNFFSPPRHLIFLIIALWLGLSLSSRYASKRGLPVTKLENLVLIALFTGLIGGRLGFAAQHPQAFIASPISLISLNTDLFDAWTAVAIGFLGVMIYFQRSKLPLWNTLDALTPALAVTAIGIGLAHLTSGKAFGTPSSLPWSIEQWGTRRHPSQVYEILAALFILVLIWRQFNKPKQAGLLFLQFTAWTSGLGLFLGAFRGDSVLTVGGVRVNQVIAWVILALTLWGITRLGKPAKLIQDINHNDYAQRR